MYKFIKTRDENNEFDKVNVDVTIPFNDLTLTDLCEAFTDFLQACGFFIDGKMVDIVNDPEKTPVEEDAPPHTDDDFIVPEGQMMNEPTNPVDDLLN